MRKKVAVINQRYGSEVNGGSEYYTKKLAEHLQPYYDVEVLTTTALDYDTWASYYPEGDQLVDGVFVRRFAVVKQRNMMKFRVINKLLHMFPHFCEFLGPLWLNVQGPYCPGLIQYIREQKNNYDTFLFVTYLYYTTAAGLPEVAEKAVFVPTAHDEFYIYLHVYQKLFQEPKGIVYLTEEEQKFVQGLFDNENVPHCVAGAGVIVPELVDVESFRCKYQINSDYVIYVGRVDVEKNCDKLFEYFTRFSQTRQNQLKLVVVGKMMMEKPECEMIQTLGFVSEEDKYSAIAGAKALIMPSEHESLSLVVLEAMALGIPVVVNGACAVLAGHCEKSEAGISYHNYEGFQDGLERLCGDTEAHDRLGEAGKRYVKENYDWDTTVEKYRELIEI